jgi:hypothetical protein
MVCLEPFDEPQGFCIGAQHQVLAIIDASHVDVIDPARATTCHGGRLKDGDVCAKVFECDRCG